MRNYVAPKVSIVLCKENVVRTSNGFTVIGTDNGVFWPGKAGEDSKWQ